MQRAAADAGIAEAWRMGDMSPREAELLLSAYARMEERAAERMDLLAWLTGSYVMQALHAPERYPRSPNRMRRSAAVMSDAQMKQVFEAMARGGEADGGR